MRPQKRSKKYAVVKLKPSETWRGLGLGPCSFKKTGDKNLPRNLSATHFLGTHLHEQAKGVEESLNFKMMFDNTGEGLGGGFKYLYLGKISNFH